jgi:hypothetical protein
MLALRDYWPSSTAGNQKPPGWVNFINTYLDSGRHPSTWPTYVALILFFTFFYVSITFNPLKVADNMKKYGGLHSWHSCGTARPPEYLAVRAQTASLCQEPSTWR